MGAFACQAGALGCCDGTYALFAVTPGTVAGAGNCGSATPSGFGDSVCPFAKFANVAATIVRRTIRNFIRLLAIVRPELGIQAHRDPRGAQPLLSKFPIVPVHFYRMAKLIITFKTMKKTGLTGIRAQKN